MKIYTSKTEVAKVKNISRPSVDTLIKRWEVKKIEIWKNKGYVIVKEFIIELLK